MKKSSRSGSASMLAGMTRKNPPGTETHMPVNMSGSVDSEPTRSGTAKSPGTLGPRSA